jgi:hypothetical protein
MRRTAGKSRRREAGREPEASTIAGLFRHGAEEVKGVPGTCFASRISPPYGVGQDSEAGI